MIHNGTGYFVCTWFQVHPYRAAFAFLQVTLELLLNSITLNLESMFLASGVRHLKGGRSSRESRRHIYFVLAESYVNCIVSRFHRRDTKTRRQHQSWHEYSQDPTRTECHDILLSNGTNAILM